MYKSFGEAGCGEVLLPDLGHECQNTYSDVLPKTREGSSHGAQINPALLIHTSPGYKASLDLLSAKV